MVTVERDREALLALANLPDKDGARIANICTENLGADDENRDASGAAESQVDLGLTE